MCGDACGRLVIERSSSFQVEGFCKDADRILYGESGGHLYLPFARLAVTCYEIRCYIADLVEKRLPDCL